jgi:hypothetical protein
MTGSWVDGTYLVETIGQRLFLQGLAVRKTSRGGGGRASGEHMLSCEFSQGKIVLSLTITPIVFFSV